LWARLNIRKLRRGNAKNYCSDACLYFWCCQCATCQDLREISFLRMAAVVHDSALPIGPNQPQQQQSFGPVMAPVYMYQQPPSSGPTPPPGYQPPQYFPPPPAYQQQPPPDGQPAGPQFGYSPTHNASEPSGYGQPPRRPGPTHHPSPF
jgi:hypothetical protein